MHNYEFDHTEDIDGKCDKQPQIIIIGGSAGHLTMHEILSNRMMYDMLMIDNTCDDTFFVNGIRYEPTAKAHIISSEYSRRATINKLELTSRYTLDQSKNQRKLDENINIIGEYELILQKKSRLSKSERDAVKIEFENLYTRCAIQ